MLLLLGLASIDNNPLVKLEAKLGLSPAPLEKFFSIKSLFSGMTEGVHQFTRLNIEEAIKANIFSPFVIPLVVFVILTWRIPKLDTSNKEYVFFASFIGLSVIVNLVN